MFQMQLTRKIWIFDNIRQTALYDFEKKIKIFADLGAAPTHSIIDRGVIDLYLKSTSTS